MQENNGEKKPSLGLLLNHYKWHILIVLFFVVFITVMVLQMCSRDGHDVSVMYAGDAVLADSHNNAIEEALKKYGKDFDGDGKVEVILYDLIIMTDEQLSAAYDKGYSTSALNFGTVQQAKNAFQGNILSDEHFVMLLSPERYEVMLQNNGLEKLADIGAVSDAMYSEYAVKLTDTVLYKSDAALSVLPEDTLVCFKKISEVNKEKSKAVARRENSVYLIKNIIGQSAGE